MSTLVHFLPRAGRGLLLAAAVFAASSTAYAQSYSAEFSEKYNEGATAFKARDMGKAFSAAKAAQGAAKGGSEKTAAAMLMANVAGASSKYAEQAEALEQLIASEGVPAGSKGQLHKALSGAYAHLNRLDKAIVEMKEALKGGGSSADYEALATMYFGARDCKNGLETLDRALGGKEPSVVQLKFKDSCYFQSKDNDRLLAVAEALLRKDPNKNWYNQILSIHQEGKKDKLDDLAQLNLLRYGFEHDYLDQEADFIKLADKALDVGTTAEAQRVLEKGIAKKIIKTMDRANRLLDQAKSRSADDAKTIVQLDAEARAGKNGDTDFKVGLRYYSMKQYDKSAEALSRALSADRVARVKRPDDANMVLGMAYTQLKKTAEAAKAFNAAKADPRMAVAAKLWLGA
jgi:tetratricopeptide (TPR) repeat protein